MRDDPTPSDGIAGARKPLSGVIAVAIAVAADPLALFKVSSLVIVPVTLRTNGPPHASY